MGTESIGAHCMPGRVYSLLLPYRVNASERKSTGQLGQLYIHIQVPSDKGTCGGGAGKGLTVLLSKSSRERGEVSREMEQGEEMKD